MARWGGSVGEMETTVLEQKPKERKKKKKINSTNCPCSVFTPLDLHQIFQHFYSHNEVSYYT